MARRSLLLLLAVLPAVAGPAEDQKELLGRIEKDLRSRRRGNAHERIVDFLGRWPESEEAPGMLRRLAELYGETGAEHAMRLHLLRRLVHTYPESWEARRVLRNLEDYTGLSFSEWKTRVRPGDALLPTRKAGPPSRFRIHRIPKETYRRAWLENEVRGIRGPDLAADDLPLVAEFALHFPADAEERASGFTYEDAGWYLVEEEVAGFVHRETVVAQRLFAASKCFPDETLVFVVDPDRGGPVAGARVTLRRKESRVLVRTGEDGLARFDVADPVAILVELDDEILGWAVWNDPAATGPRVHVTTDRPIYRPGHEVRWKAVRRDVKGPGALALPPPEEVRVEVRDPRGRTLSTAQHTWNGAGSLSGSFRLGDEPPLGIYTVLVHEPAPFHVGSDWWFGEVQGAWTGRFRVEEYRKPEIEISVEPLPADGRTVRARIRARTFTGSPVAGADVEWTAERLWTSPEGPSYRMPFDDARGWWPRHFRNRDWFDEDSGDLVGEGEGTTDADGVLEIAFRGARVFSDYRVEATVTDLTGLSATETGSIRRRPASLTVRVDTAHAFYEVGGRVAGRVRVRDLDGEPVASRPVEIVAFLRELDSTWDEYESYHRVEVTTEASGVARFAIPVQAAGDLLLRARARDDDGRRAEDRIERRAVRLGGVVQEHDDDPSMPVLPERGVYEAGERIRLLVEAPRTPIAALLVVEGATVHDARWVELRERFSIVHVPVTAAMVPDVRLRLHAWKEGEAWGGGWRVFVHPGDRILRVQVSTDRAAYRPGEWARVRIVTRDRSGAPVPAEVELAIVDESIYRLAEDTTPDIRAFFHPRTPEWYDVGGFLQLVSVKDQFDPPEVGAEGPTTPLFGGQAEEEPASSFAGSAALADADGPRVRRRFADTLHFDAHVDTQADGVAEEVVRVPDNLTRWRIVARAVAGADRFGRGSSSMLTRQDVVVRIGAPRFLTEGDVARIPTVVRNDTDEDLRFAVRLRVEGGEGGGAGDLHVPAGTERRLVWPVVVSRPGRLRLLAEARAAGGEDATRVELPVHGRGIEMTQVWTGAIAAGWTASIELPGSADRSRTRLEIRPTTTAAGAIESALPYLAGYPYGCVEQTLSRFLPSVVAARALRRLGLWSPRLESELPYMVRSGLQRLYAYQHEDGGWGWWTNDESDPYMTAYVLFGLASARDAGYDVDPLVVEAGVGWLGEQRRALDAFALFALARSGADVGEELAAAKPRNLAERAFLVLAGRKDLAAGLDVPSTRRRAFVHTQALGLALWATATADPEDPRVPDLMGRLLSLRRGAAWTTTLDSAYAVFGLAAAAAAEERAPVSVGLGKRDLEAHDGSVLVVPGAELRSGKNRLRVQGGDRPWSRCTAVLRYRNEGEVAPHAGDLAVERTFEALRDGEWRKLASGAEVAAGEPVRLRLRVRSKAEVERILVEAPIPAGTEAFAAEPQEYDWFGSWYLRRELRDDRVAIAVSEMVAGADEEFVCRLRPTIPGTYRVRPAVAFPMYDPDRRAWSGSFVLKVASR